jgi:hypothetical protein
MPTSIHEDYSRAGLHGGSGPGERGFGIVFAGFFIVVGLYPLVRGASIRVWALVLAAAFLFCAFCLPGLLAPLNRVWTRFGLVLGRMTNPVILGVIFFFVFVPVSLLQRLLRRDALRLRFDNGMNSYWIRRDPPGPDPKTMAHQF